ncbi:TPA: hypothetical protein RQJ46_004451 [Vibrio vulnificus]|nr:hypothetical protein [Vibrio vulnificus]HDY7498412.1 hypothetical protein [Vibrio vulnificus]
MDKVIVACCIALMLSGMIFGISLNSGSDTLDATYKVFGVVSGLAASLTVLVALKALSTWKEQFFHNILYEKMTELESIGRNVIGSVKQRKLAQEQLRLKLSTEDCDYYEKLKESANVSFRKSMEEYRINVDRIYPLLDKAVEEKFPYTYIKFSQQAYNLLRSVDALFDDEFNQEVSNQVDDDILKLTLDFKEELRSHWRR